MKPIILLLLGLLGICSREAVGASLKEKQEADRREAEAYRAAPQKLRADLDGILRNMRQNNAASTATKFTAAREELSTKLYQLQQNRVPIPPEVGNPLAEALINIYEDRRKYDNNRDFLPIEVAATYGDSPAVKRYLTRLLKETSGRERTLVLVSLAWSQNLRGDAELYSVLEGMYRAEGHIDPVILGVMSRLDRKKALPLVLKEVETTKDVKLFNKGADLISEYGRPELLEVVIRRVPEFPRKSWGAEDNPTLGIYPELLLKYLEQAEGTKLDQGLHALGQSIIALRGSAPLIQKKLKSPDPRSRRAVADFLREGAALSVLSEESIVRATHEAAQRETDGDARRALEAAAKALREKVEGK